MIESDLGVLRINKLGLGIVIPRDMGFWEDNQVRFIRGRFADESDGFGDGRFGVEKYRGDVAGCVSISTAIPYPYACGCIEWFRPTCYLHFGEP